MNSEYPIMFPSLWVFEYPYAQNFFSSWSIFSILKMKGIDSCEEKQMAVSD